MSNLLKGTRTQGHLMGHHQENCSIDSKTVPRSEGHSLILFFNSIQLILFTPNFPPGKRKNKIAGGKQKLMFLSIKSKARRKWSFDAQLNWNLEASEQEPEVCMHVCVCVCAHTQAGMDTDTHPSPSERLKDRESSRQMLCSQLKFGRKEIGNMLNCSYIVVNMIFKYN